MAENSENNDRKDGKDPKRKVVRVRINFSWFYILLILAIGWMLFSANGAEHILPMLQSLVTVRSEGHALFWLREMGPVLVAAALCCVPALVNGAKKLMKRLAYLRFAVMLALLLLSLAALTKSSYNPCLYFRF